MRDAAWHVKVLGLAVAQFASECARVSDKMTLVREVVGGNWLGLSSREQVEVVANRLEARLARRSQILNPV